MFVLHKTKTTRKALGDCRTLASTDAWRERDLNCLTVMEVVQHKNNCS